VDEVVDVSGPEYACRNYLEQSDVRSYLLRADKTRPVNRAADMGCGYGRLTPVLAEGGANVVGFEREQAFVDTGRRLWPQYQFVQVNDLASIPVPDDSFDFVLSFTVLQHVPESAVQRVAAELRRLLRPGGHLLLCEETDESHVAEETTGRSVARYGLLLAPLRLIDTSARRIEPTYPRPDVGTYMLFCRSRP
jgi:SAM-dependent methyltransferase